MLTGQHAHHIERSNTTLSDDQVQNLDMDVKDSYLLQPGACSCIRLCTQFGLRRLVHALRPSATAADAELPTGCR